MPPARDTSRPSEPRVRFAVEQDAEEAAGAAAARLCAAARSGGQLVLAGGSTPRRAYELAAELEPDWSRAGVWLGDERLVPADDERANRRLVGEALLARLRGQPSAHWVDTGAPADVAAARYARDLEGVALDLVLLGLGGDGHTASLFPGMPAVEERTALAVSTAPGLEPWVERVTLTIPALCSAREVVFLVTGSSKAEAVRRAFAEPPSPAIPASLVRSRTGSTTAVLDESAAALL